MGKYQNKIEMTAETGEKLVVWIYPKNIGVSIFRRDEGASTHFLNLTRSQAAELGKALANLDDLEIV